MAKAEQPSEFGDFELETDDGIIEIDEDTAIIDLIGEVWEDNPTIYESDLFKEYVTRVRNNRDMHILVTGRGETGVGKTTMAVCLCLLFDFHGFSAEKAKYTVPDFNNSYFKQPPGSWMLADDVQKWMDRRESMKRGQRHQTQDIQANRVRQVFVAWTAPSKEWLDKRLGDIADFWVECLEDEYGQPQGKARVYRLKSEDHYGEKYEKRVENIHWPPLDDNEVFQNIQEKKLEWIKDDVANNYIEREKAQERIEEVREEQFKKARFEMLTGLYELLQERGVVGRGGCMTQEDIAEAISRHSDEDKLTASGVSRIVNADSYEDYYSN